MVLEVINSSLSHNLPGNPHLVYSLLYQHEMFEEFRLHPAFNDIISNIEMVRVWIRRDHDHSNAVQSKLFMG